MCACVCTCTFSCDRTRITTHRNHQCVTFCIHNLEEHKLVLINKYNKKITEKFKLFLCSKQKRSNSTTLDRNSSISHRVCDVLLFSGWGFGKHPTSLTINHGLAFLEGMASRPLPCSGFETERLSRGTVELYQFKINAMCNLRSTNSQLL